MSTRRVREVADRNVLISLLDSIQVDEAPEALLPNLEVLCRFLTQKELETRVGEIFSKSNSRNFFHFLLKKINSVKSYALAVTMIQWTARNFKRLGQEFKESLANDPSDERLKLTYQELAENLVKLPQKLINLMKLAMKKEEADFFHGEIQVFEEKLMSIMEDSLQEAYSMIGRANLVNLSFLAFFIAKGRNMIIERETVVSRVFRFFSTRSDDEKWTRIGQKIFTDENLGPKETESLVFDVVFMAEAQKDLETCFGTSTSTLTVNRMLTRKVLFQKAVSTQKLEIIISFLSEADVKSVFETALKLWSQATFLRCSTPDQEKQVTMILLICLRRITFMLERKIDLKLSYIDVMSMAMEGLEFRLDSGDRNLRETGMFLAESLSKLRKYLVKTAESEDTKTEILTFEYENENDAWLKSMRSILLGSTLISAPSDTIKVDDQIASTSRLDSGLYAGDRTQVDENFISQSSEVVDLDSDDEDFPTFYVPDEEKSCEPLKPGEEVNKTIAPPVYIQDCFEMLHEKEKYDVFEAAFHTVESLIRRNAIGFSQISRRLYIRILLLQDNFTTPDFENKRMRILTSLLVSRPQLVPELMDFILSNAVSMGHRHMFLMSVSKASEELARDEKTAKIEEIQEENWQKVIEDRLKAKTKYFSKGRKSERIVENRLAKVATTFFYPLLIERTGENIQLRGKDSNFLARLVFVASNVLKLAGLTSNSPRMAISLLQYTTSLRYHESKMVQSAAKFAFHSVATTLDYELLVEMMGSDSVHDWCDWIQESENEKIVQI